MEDETAAACLRIHFIYRGSLPPEAAPAAVVVVLEGARAGLSAADQIPKLP